MNIFVKQSIPASPEALLQVLLKHENLDRFFNARFSIVHDQDNNEIDGGKGCIREVTTAGLTFQEQILKADDDAIEYRIIGNFVLKNHFGKIVFCPNNNSSAIITDVEYSIVFQTPWYLPNNLIKHVIERDITKAMDKLKGYFNES